MLLLFSICIIIATLIFFFIFKTDNKNYSKKFTKIHNKLIESHKNNFSDKMSNIPTYYINLNRSIDRKNNIEKYSTLYNIKLNRIEAIDAQKINFDKDSINLNPEKYIQFINNYKKETINELACTLSHIKAIYTAYTKGDNIALILEDDTSFGLYPLWKNNLNDIIKTLPSDWKILNLSSFYYGTKKYDKPFIKYYNFPLGAYAYIINRDGMKNILYDILNKNKIILGSNYHRDGTSLLADRLIFHRSLNSYIYTKDALFYPYNDYNELNSTINKGYIDIHIKTYLNVIKKFI